MENPFTKSEKEAYQEAGLSLIRQLEKADVSERFQNRFIKEAIRFSRAESEETKAVFIEQLLKIDAPLALRAISIISNKEGSAFSQEGLEEIYKRTAIPLEQKKLTKGYADDISRKWYSGPMEEKMEVESGSPSQERLLTLFEAWSRKFKNVEFQGWEKGFFEFYAAFYQRHYPETEKSGFELAARYFTGFKEKPNEEPTQRVVRETIRSILRAQAMKKFEDEWVVMTRDLTLISGSPIYRLNNELVEESPDGTKRILHYPLPWVEKELAESSTEEPRPPIDEFTDKRLGGGDPRSGIARAWLHLHTKGKYWNKERGMQFEQAMYWLQTEMRRPSGATRENIIRNLAGRDATMGRPRESPLAMGDKRIEGEDPLEDGEPIGSFDVPINTFLPTHHACRYNEKRGSWISPGKREGQLFSRIGETQDANLVLEPSSIERPFALPLPPDSDIPTFVFDDEEEEVPFDPSNGTYVVDTDQAERLQDSWVLRVKIPVHSSVIQSDAELEGSESALSEYDQKTKDRFPAKSPWLERLNVLDAEFESFLETVEGQSNIERALIALKHLREQGLYDMETRVVRSEWKSQPLADRLKLMRMRAKELTKYQPVEGGAEYAGVCADYSFLALDILRRLGIPSGIAVGFQAVNGEISTKSSHGMPFVLIPVAGEKGSYVRTYIDPTPSRMTDRHKALKALHEDELKNKANKKKTNKFGRRKKSMEVPPEIETTVRVAEALAGASGLWYLPRDKDEVITDQSIIDALRDGLVRADKGRNPTSTGPETLEFSIKHLVKRIARDRKMEESTAEPIVEKILREAIFEQMTDGEREAVLKAIIKQKGSS